MPFGHQPTPTSLPKKPPSCFQVVSDVLILYIYSITPRPPPAGRSGSATPPLPSYGRGAPAFISSRVGSRLHSCRRGLGARLVSSGSRRAGLPLPILGSPRRKTARDAVGSDAQARRLSHHVLHLYSTYLNIQRVTHMPVFRCYDCPPSDIMPRPISPRIA